MLGKVKIIYEDESFLAIDKPSGLVVHGDGRTEEDSLVDWISKYVGENRNQQEKVGNPHTLDSGRYFARWGIINRLDRETSGIILIAKTIESFENLQEQFIDRTIIKEYIAKVFGEINLEKLIKENKIFRIENSKLYKIIKPISRHKKDPRIWVCGLTSGEGGRNTARDAETELEIFSPQSLAGEREVTLLKLFPKTGRTHQLRLHSRFIGHPIVGDRKYGINGITNEHSTNQIDDLLKNLGEEDLELEKNSRLMLHAKSLELLHPVTNTKIRLETILPEEFDL